MNDHRWFKLLVRAIGIWILASNVPAFVAWLGSLAPLLYRQTGGGMPMDYYLVQIIASLISTAAVIVIGIYLLSGAKGLVAWCTRGMEGRCPRCDYDIAGLPDEALCPECGLKLPPRRKAPAIPPAV